MSGKKSTKYSSNLKDYNLKELIGKGTFGSVYKGIHKPNNKRVAIKIIEFKKLKQTTNGISRIKTEIEVQSKLNHDGVVKLYESFIHIDPTDESKKYILILEYCHGGTLSDYLKQQKCGRLSETDCYEIFYQLTEITKYLHENQIIHRDLKLQNILIHKSKKIKLCDFGLATSTEISPDRYTMCGTPNYCAPEIARHEKHGYLVDVWSLGIILYTLLTGSPPFHTGNTKQTLNKIINHKKINIPHYLSNAASMLIKKLLHKSPNQRINTTHIFNEVWMQRHGKPLNIINIKYLKSMKRHLNKLNVTIEIIENIQSSKIWWNEGQFYLQIFNENQKIYVVDIQKNIKKEYNLNTLPIDYYKIYDVLASFMSIISTQTPMIALFVNHHQNKYNLKRIVLLHNKDIDFTFSSCFVHYSYETNSIQCNNERPDDNDNDNEERMKLCQHLIKRIHKMYHQHKSYPIEMKFDLHSKIAIKKCNKHKWKYYLPDNLICIRTKNGKSKQIFEFEDNQEISIIIQGKQTPFLIEKSNDDNKIEITSQKGLNYNKYWKCVTTVLQL